MDYELELGDWIQYVAINGESRFGKVDGFQRNNNDDELCINLKLLNGKTDLIYKNWDWFKVRPNEAFLLDKKYNDNNNRTNDLQQRKRKDTVNHPAHYTYGDIETIDYCDQVCKTYPPELAPYVFNAIKYLSRANMKNGQEDINKAKFYVQRLFDKWEG